MEGPKLATVWNDKVVFAEYGAKVCVCGHVLINPDEALYRSLGFDDLPTTDPPEGWHDEYTVGTRYETQYKCTGKVWTGVIVHVDDHDETVLQEVEVWDYVQVPVHYVQAVRAKDVPPPPQPPEIVRYSKYKIKCKLVDMGLWDDVKAAIEAAGYWDSFIIINDIASDNQELKDALPLLHEMFPAVDIPALLAECVED